MGTAMIEAPQATPGASEGGHQPWAPRLDLYELNDRPAMPNSIVITYAQITANLFIYPPAGTLLLGRVPVAWRSAIRHPAVDRCMATSGGPYWI
jgi:hypothetical protein